MVNDAIRPAAAGVVVMVTERELEEVRLIYESLFRRAGLWLGPDGRKPVEVMEKLRAIDNPTARDLDAIEGLDSFLWVWQRKD